ncbi:MAG: 30S ribosomal protein S16 [Alphaproteobacteria bacterium]
MSIAIRMSRGGSKKRPFYNIVVADTRAPRDGRYVEKIGFFNPMVPKDSEERMRINQERAQYWLSVGAIPSDRVAKFLSLLGLIEARKYPEQTKQHLPKAKAQERIREREEAAQKAAEAEAAAKAEAEAAANAPSEEPAADDSAAGDSAA